MATGTGFADLPWEVLDVVLSRLKAVRPDVYHNCVRLTCKEWLYSYRRLGKTLDLSDCSRACLSRGSKDKGVKALNLSSFWVVQDNYPGLVNLKIDQSYLEENYLNSGPLGQVAWESVEVSSPEYHPLERLLGLPVLLSSSLGSLRELSLKCGKGDYKYPHFLVNHALQTVLTDCTDLRHVGLEHIDLSQGGRARFCANFLCGSQVVSVRVRGALIGTDLCHIGTVFPNVEELLIQDTNTEDVAIYRKAFHSREQEWREAMDGVALKRLRVLEYKLRLRGIDYEMHWALYTKQALLGHVPSLDLLVTNGHTAVLQFWNKDGWESVKVVKCRPRSLGMVGCDRHGREVDK